MVATLRRIANVASAWRGPNKRRLCRSGIQIIVGRKPGRHGVVGLPSTTNGENILVLT